MNEPSNFHPLETESPNGGSAVPVMLLSGYSDSDVAMIYDLLVQAGFRYPAMAMVTEHAQNWQLGEYLEMIRSEHREFLNQQKR